MGKYVVSPSTHPTDCGRFRASFSVHRSQGNGSYCRVFRFDKAFASSEAARLFAVRLRADGPLAANPYPFPAADCTVLRLHSNGAPVCAHLSKEVFL